MPSLGSIDYADLALVCAKMASRFRNSGLIVINFMHLIERRQDLTEFRRESSTLASQLHNKRPVPTEAA